MRSALVGCQRLSGAFLDLFRCLGRLLAGIIGLHKRSSQSAARPMTLRDSTTEWRSKKPYEPIAKVISLSLSIPPYPPRVATPIAVTFMHYVLSSVSPQTACTGVTGVFRVRSPSESYGSGEKEVIRHSVGPGGSKRCGEVSVRRYGLSARCVAAPRALYLPELPRLHALSMEASGCVGLHLRRGVKSWNPGI
jgi:hypothetical protein